MSVFLEYENENHVENKALLDQSVASKLLHLLLFLLESAIYDGVTDIPLARKRYVFRKQDVPLRFLRRLFFLFQKK
jgi:hypothetical protein